MPLAAVIISALACLLAAWALWRTRRPAGAQPAVRDAFGASHGDDARGALKHVAVVRYDAFADMAGLLSFSAALVDDDGDGLVISSIHARGESRTYAKGIDGGVGTSELSPEEKQAVASARAGKEMT